MHGTEREVEEERAVARGLVLRGDRPDGPVGEVLAEVVAATVGYTGEIQTIASGCAYKSDEPITVGARVLFELGRGPQAVGRQKTYRYWVAVTDRNRLITACAMRLDPPVSRASIMAA